MATIKVVPPPAPPQPEYDVRFTHDELDAVVSALTIYRNDCLRGQGATSPQRLKNLLDVLAPYVRQTGTDRT